MLTGTENLVSYLTTDRCFGHLGLERFHKDPDTFIHQPGQPLVLKVEIERAYKKQHKGSGGLNRLDVLKQMFEVRTAL